MDKKNLAATIATLLTAMLFIVIGASFTSFMYKDKIIKVEDVRLLATDNIAVFNSEGDKKIEVLKLSDMKLGLKPATGEEDEVTLIPSTVSTTKGSEGMFSTFKIYAPLGASIYITNIKIDTKESNEKIEKERENIMVAIREINNSTSNLKEDKVLLGSIEPNDERIELTLFVWLSSKAGDVLKGSKIYFSLSFE